MAHDEIEETEGMEQAEDAAPAATEFVPEQSAKPKSDVYTMLLALTFTAFLAGCIVAGREAWENYDVQFWVFTKHPAKGVDNSAPAPKGADTAAPTPAPEGAGMPK